MSQSESLANSFITERNLKTGEIKHSTIKPNQTNNAASQWKQAARNGQATSTILFIIKLTSFSKEGYRSQVQPSWDTIEANTWINSVVCIHQGTNFTSMEVERETPLNTQKSTIEILKEPTNLSIFVVSLFLSLSFSSKL